MSYAIFRVQGIRTTGDLKGIGKHNLERVSYTNLDIDASMSAENIHLISPPDSKTYMNRFSEIVEPMKLEHEEKMKSERKDRVKSFEAKINSSKSDVASEFLFTSDEKFFEGMSKDQVKKWAETCLEFVKKDIGIQESQMLHAVVHMDEKTPHLHIVAVPLVKKFDGRAKREVWQINRKHFIGGKDQLSELQDKYHQHMLKHGYDLERGIKGSESRHVNPVKFKAQEEMRKLENEREALKSEVDGLQKAVQVSKKIDEIPFEEKKPLLGGSKTVKLASEDFDYIKALAKESEGLKTALNGLKNDNEELMDQNIILQNQNKQLKKEKQKLISKNLEMERHYKNQQEQLAKENEELIKQNQKLQRYKEHLEKLIENIKEYAEKFIGVKLGKINTFVAVLRVERFIEDYGEKIFKGESWKQLVPKVEHDLAEQYLENKNKSVQQVAEKQNDYEMKNEKPKSRDDGMER